MVKTLHCAKSIDELTKISEVKIPSSLNLDRCIEKMNKLQGCIKKAHLDKDEEEEFMFLHRYLSVLKSASKFSDFTKAKQREHYMCAQDNVKKYEILKDTLASRYEEEMTKEKNKQNTRLSKKADSSPTQEKTLKDLTNHKTAGKTCIHSEELYSLLNSKNNNNNSTSYIIIDVRPEADFKESHLIFSNVVNIPEEIIRAGMSAEALSKALPHDVKEKWEKRNAVNILVILDWNSSQSSLNKEAKLYHLRVIMSKWDTRTYKCQPMILEGGFEDFIAKYPHVTTNPNFKPPLCEDNKALFSFDKSFEYPMQALEQEEEKKPKPAPVETPRKKPEVNGLIVDRSTKPTLILEPEAKQTEIIEEPVEEVEVPEDQNNQSVEEPLTLQKESTTNNNDENISSLPEGSSNKDGMSVPNQILSELRKVKPDIPVRPHSSETIIAGSEVSQHKLRPGQDNSGNKSFLKRTEEEGTYKIGLKKDDAPTTGGILKRASSSPNIAKLDYDAASRIPSFDRGNKPAAYAERTDSTYGQTASGLTGLKNFANNCYMNSILQCLSNTEFLVKELISIDRRVTFNYHSKTKGRVAQEVITAFRNLWSGSIRVYTIKDLKTLLGDLKDIFKGSGHQDSNEFLIILLEYLHDDLNIPAEVNVLNGAREETGEKAWGEFRRKNCSIIQRLFYGQHRSTVTCSSCKHSSVTFEQFFNLFVPIPSKDTVTLNECIQLYMSGEKISGWKCPECKDERNATKKFDISVLPPILVIALKRFTNEEDSWLQKKENLVKYPLDGLNMEKFTVKGSDQRYKMYNLYAMSTHTGTLRAGHYKAICKNAVTDKWYMYDDQSVDSLPVHGVQNNPEVYILFYNAVLSNC